MKSKKAIAIIAITFILLIALSIPFCKNYDKMLFLRIDSVSDIYIPKRIADEYAESGIIDTNIKWLFKLSEQELERAKNNIFSETSPWKQIAEKSYQCTYDLTNRKFIDTQKSDNAYKTIQFNANTANCEYTAVLSSY
ncbi:MAG: hypothetical protein NC122_08965 [Faecalibacterium sp.]|nr:hypothetical protein [Ruminococcus sp.]MCM1392845.1 hypothetical protein [Ruminococcus sp.]MCM1486325.1 hypothetical protein [Faecalibacterium sp.]